MSEAERAFLRHILATIAYRGGKALRDAPPAFESFRAAPDSRSAGEVLAHLGDLFDWALHICDGRQVWADSPALPWSEGSARLFAALTRLDARLAAPESVPADAGRLFQGPMADALTHVGQIAMLRRLAGFPVKGENYFKAEIVAGRVGPDQAGPRREF